LQSYQHAEFWLKSIQNLAEYGRTGLDYIIGNAHPKRLQNLLPDIQ